MEKSQFFDALALNKAPKGIKERHDYIEDIAMSFFNFGGFNLIFGMGFPNISFIKTDWDTIPVEYKMDRFTKDNKFFVFLCNNLKTIKKSLNGQKEAGTKTS